MVKRKASTEDYDSKNDLSQSAAKRAKTNGDSQVDYPTSEDSNLGEDTFVDNISLDGEMDEGEQFEARWIDPIRRAVDRKRNCKIQGRVAQHGIIQHIEMHQFMCHPRLSISLGPQINFIVGHNGSGKSAILTALTVALGGKALVTGRGNGLKSFIRDGQQVAEVSVTISNEGDEAYRHDKYGDSIIVTRRFTRAGSSSYKIKSKDGRVISTKREELSAICDYMNIQVDNPMNVLNQDTARQFLSGANAREKYHLFLKGALLRQLSEEYDMCLANVRITRKIVEARQSAVPDMRKGIADLAVRYTAAQKAAEKRKEVETLKRELTWAHVAGKQKALSEALEKSAMQERKISKCEEGVAKAQSSLDVITKAVDELKAQLRGCGNLNEIEAEKSRVQDKFKENKEKLYGFLDSEREMTEELHSINKLIEDYEVRIAEETAKLNENKQAQREERERKIQAAKADVASYETIIRELNDQIGALEERRLQMNHELEKVKKEWSEAHGKSTACEKQCAELEKQMANRLEAYGRNLPQVLERIKHERWHGDIPIGPIGNFVMLNDMKWQFLMRAQLGYLMLAFVVTDARDRPLLRRILYESDNPGAQIIVSAKDMFDYSHGEPPSEYVTVLRALNIRDEFVKRVLINQSRIERVLLAQNRAQAQTALDSLGGAKTAWAADRHRIQNFGDGGGQTVSIPQLRHDDRRQMLFVGGNRKAEMERWKSDMRAALDERDAAGVKGSELESEMVKCDAELNELRLRASEIDGKLRTAKRTRDTLMAEHNEDVPVSIQALEDAKLEQEENKKSLLNQFEDLAKRREEVNQDQKPLMEALEGFKKQIETYKERKDEILGQIAEAEEKRLRPEHDLRHYQNRLEAERTELVALGRTAQEMEAEFNSWSAAALAYCDGERIETERSPDEIETRIDSIQSALKGHEHKQGATVEELEEEIQTAQKKYETFTAELEDLVKLNNMLSQSLAMREIRWLEFRGQMAVRTRINFQHNLSLRCFWGDVHFDHKGQKLTMKVQTEEQANTQGSREKDTRSLSGGEKSFSTVCLLLSVWEAIGCPIRCLDEFDVFMDAVNRNVSVDMLINIAKSSSGKQYIIITPQGMSSVKYESSVNVIRMADPERAQSVLR